MSAIRKLLDRGLAKIGVVRIDRLRKRNAYAGATASRLTQDWFTSLLSADQELRTDLRRLRARARELSRDTPYGRQFARLITSNVAGPHGLALAAINRTAAGEPFQKLNDQLEEAFGDWGASAAYVSADGRLDWVDMQQLAIRTVAIDGECILRKRRDTKNPYGYSLQFYDADQLDETMNRQAADGVNQIRMGVELDKDNKAVAYWLWSSHPYDYYVATRERIRVPASEIIHLFIPFRPGQTRGVPWLAPVMLALRMMDGYQEAELVAARTGASAMGFIETDPDHADAYVSAGTDGALEMEIEPGLVKQLIPGQTFNGWSPEHPTTAYKDFTKAILRAVSGGIGVSYQSLSNDLEGTSFASGRAGLIAERDEYRLLQRWFASHFHREVYTDWVGIAQLAGAVTLPTYDALRWSRCKWKGRGWDWVDPLKDVQAIEAEIRLGLNTRSNACDEMGRDFDENLEELQKEQDAAEAAGVDVQGIGGGVFKEADPSQNSDGTDETKPPADDSQKDAAVENLRSEIGGLAEIVEARAHEVRNTVRDLGARVDQIGKQDITVVIPPKARGRMRIVRDEHNQVALIEEEVGA